MRRSFFQKNQSDDAGGSPPARASTHPVFRGDAYGIVTADEPKFPVREEGGNKALEEKLKREGLKFDRVAGHYDKPENSYLVYGPTIKQMHQLGQDFGQESIIFGQGGRHEFHFVNGPNAGQYVKNREDNPVSFFNSPPQNYWTSLPGGGFFRINLDPFWKLLPLERTQKNDKDNLKAMSMHNIHDLGTAVYARLKKFEADFIELRKRELSKAGHMEPGMHEAPVAGASEHMEPGGHEQYEMNVPNKAPAQPVSSSIGMPAGELAAPPQDQPTSADPNVGIGEALCPTCGQDDRPGSCTCMDSSGMQFAKLGDHPSASGTPLALSEDMCKGCGKMHKAADACMTKGADFIDSSGKKKSTGVVGVLPKTDDDLGPNMSGPASKEIPSPGSGGASKKKPLAKKAESGTKKAIVTGTPPIPAAGSIASQSGRMARAEPPMAKPPSGKNPATMTPAAKPKAPKVGGAPSAPAGAGSSTISKPKKMPTGGPFGKSESLSKAELGNCPLCSQLEHLGACPTQSSSQATKE